MRLFYDAFEATTHQYLIDVRVERAKALLAAEHGSVTHVCLEVSSLGSFSALFARRVGRSPRGWRRHICRYGLALRRANEILRLALSGKSRRG